MPLGPGDIPQVFRTRGGAAVVLLLVLGSAGMVGVVITGVGPLGNAGVTSGNETRWSNAQTWDGDVPQQGEVVTITEGMNVVLDESPPPLAGINISGGSLRFARIDLELEAGYIIVTDGGEFRVGTEDDPFQHEAVITLNGSRAEQPGHEQCGVAGLCSMGGSLELHGEVNGTTWTQLNETAQAGDEEITLAEPVDWEAGDEIALTSTSLDPADVDRRTITAVDGRTVELDGPLNHTHYGELQQFGSNDQYTVDERGEVLLLSRNVVIQGNDGSESDRFGGHVMAMNGNHTEQMDRAESGENWSDIWADYENDPELMPHISGVEFRRMGQEGELSRYPFHWHRYGNASGSYIENASIHNTYQRCVTIHGTQNATVENNVAFNVTGHCYFMEGGNENGTHLERNVGALVRPFSSEDREHILSDAAPAAFWMNGPPNSTVVDNVAAGVYGHGFWVDLENNGGHPTRLNQPLGTWDGNVAHSIHSNEPGTEQNIRISQSGRTFINTTGGAGFLIEGGEGEFTDLTVYNSPAGFWNDDATNIPVRNSTIANTRNALWFQDGGVVNSTIVAHTDNTGELETEAEQARGYTLPEPGSTRMGSAESVTGLVAFYQGARSVNTAYIGYNTSDDVPHGVFGTMGQIRSNPYFAAGTHLIDSNPYLPDLPKEGRNLTVESRVIPSADGGLVGNYDGEFNISEFDGSEYRELRWGSDHLTDWESCEPIDHIGTLADHTFNRSVYSCTSRSVMASFPHGNYSVNGTVYEDVGGRHDYLESNRTYRYQETLSPDFEADFEGDLRVERGYPGDYVVFAFPMAAEPNLTHVGQPPGGELVAVNSSSAVQSNESLSETRYYWDSANSTLWLRVVANPDSANEFGTAPFADEFGVPVKRSRDNGVQFD